MSAFRLTPSFLRDFARIENDLTETEAHALDRLLADVAARPLAVNRVPSFYDPDHPAWLTRSGPFLLHYAFDEDADLVTFLNLFRRR